MSDWEGSWWNISREGKKKQKQKKKSLFFCYIEYFLTLSVGCLRRSRQCRGISVPW